MFGLKESITTNREKATSENLLEYFCYVAQLI